MGLDLEPRSLGPYVQEHLCVQTAGLPVQTHLERALSLLVSEPQAGKSKIMALAESVSGEGSLPGS